MNKHCDIFMFIDALGWDVVSRYNFLADFPHRKPVTMQFGYSSTAIPTILTGAQPSEHGHLSLFAYSPEHSPFKGLAHLGRFLRPTSFWERGRVRNVLTRIARKYYGFTGYFNLYSVPFDRIGLLDYMEKDDIFAKGGLLPCKNLRDILEEKKIPYHISDWRKSEEENLAAATAAIIEEKVEFMFIYTATLDALRHDHSLDETVVRDKILWYESRIRELLETAKSAYDSFTFTVISDHGMTDLTQAVDMINAVESTGLVFNDDYAACYDSTMFRVHYLKESSRDVIHGVVNEKTFPGHWLSDDDLVKYGIDFADRRYGDDIFLMKPGVQIVPSNLCRKTLHGMHGYEPSHENSLAAVISTAEIPNYVHEVKDYFRMMTERYFRH
ncbi:MAG: alkaline phosphatase family protein [Victivallales bacterium]|nr:alkaline phosphatase family protein [Victivallales bacterium]